jgi:hypothetical protein
MAHHDTVIVSAGAFGIFAWIVMHNLLLAAFPPAPPSYTVYSVINGLMSHTAGRRSFFSHPKRVGGPQAHPTEIPLCVSWPWRRS